MLTIEEVEKMLADNGLVVKKKFDTPDTVGETAEVTLAKAVRQLVKVKVKVDETFAVTML